jgi:hypothetical protein
MEGIGADTIRGQLQRLLEDDLFRHSRRYPALLRYVVEQTIQGRAHELKERTIGIDVFGRKPNYDLASDPVVRITASEIRKRLAQYYVQPAKLGELRIEMTAGAYVPSFRYENSAPALPAQELPHSLNGEPRLMQPLHLAARPSTGEGWKVALALVVFALGVAAGAAVNRFYARKQPQLVDLLQSYWGPVYGTAEPVLFCVETEKSLAFASKTSDGRYILLDNTATLMRVATPLTSGGKAYRVMAASDVTFEQLRRGPFVLIGFSNNPWTQRLSRDLPFSFHTQGSFVSIIDNRDSKHSKWENQEGSSEFAILARVRDSTTHQASYIVAGLTTRGTESASTLLATPDQVARLLVNHPQDWSSQNFEAVIRMSVIDGHPGAPSIVQTAYWPSDPK